jgi:hypothetical protein
MTKPALDVDSAVRGAGPGTGLEEALIRLMARLEQLLVCLSDPAVQQRPASALKGLLGMVDQVVAFAERRVDAEAHGPGLTKLLASAGDLYSSAEVLRGQLSDSVVVSLFKLFNKEPVRESQRAELYREVVAAARAVLQEAFALFTACLPASARPGWEPAQAAFLSDFARIADNLRF